MSKMKEEFCRQQDMKALQPDAPDDSDYNAPSWIPKYPLQTECGYSIGLSEIELILKELKANEDVSN